MSVLLKKCIPIVVYEWFTRHWCFWWLFSGPYRYWFSDVLFLKYDPV